RGRSAGRRAADGAVFPGRSHGRPRGFGTGHFVRTLMRGRDGGWTGEEDQFRIRLLLLLLLLPLLLETFAERLPLGVAGSGRDAAAVIGAADLARGPKRHSRKHGRA
ncbi:MAG: hypothetical protein ACK55I_06570, partial [bacterium]